MSGSKQDITSLHLQSDCMMKHYIKTVEEHLRKVITANQRDCNTRLPIFLLVYRASTHDTMGLTLASLVFWRQLRLPCNLLFGAPPDKEWPTIDHAADLVDHLYNIHNFVHQHLKLVSDHIKTQCGRWPTLRATRRVTKCDSITQPAWRGSHPSFNPCGRAHTG
jgi:hypothetical protein